LGDFAHVGAKPLGGVTPKFFWWYISPT